MSDLYKEWREVLREYIEQQPPVDNDTYWVERKRLNKEYALNQSSTTVEQTNEENDNG
jgi:hypothetical protein